MSIGQSMIPEFDLEMAGTRKVLERVPDDKIDWKIHDKSNTIGWVANHLADIPHLVDMAIHSDEYDVDPEDGKPYELPNERTSAAIVALFDKNVAQARSLMETVSDETLHQSWSVTKRGEVLMTMPRLVVLRSWVINHAIHHRAHLCVYYRVNGILVPGLYGPSADDDGM